MATLLEMLGEGTFAKLHEIVTQRPESTVVVPAATPHQYDDCSNKSRCPEHRRAYRMLLKARKDVTATVTTSSTKPAELALRVLADRASTMPEANLIAVCKIARIDNDPIRVLTVTRGEQVQSDARRALALVGK